MKCIKVFKKDEVIAIITFRNKLVIAAKKGVYIYPSGKKLTFDKPAIIM